jgi:hypothetical protein
MIEAALLANPWYAAALVVAVYIFGYVVALYEARLYVAGVDEHIRYRGGYALAREYADAWGRRRPASWRFLALLVLMAVAIPLVGQVALQRFSQPELFLAIVGGWCWGRRPRAWNTCAISPCFARCSVATA